MRRRRNPEVIAGRVNTDAGILASTDEFSARRVSVGQWSIIFPKDFNAISIVASCGSAYEFIIARIEPDGTATVATSTTTGAGTGAADIVFDFVAVGIQQ